ncbi:hypothetical protein KK101_12560 [Curtobacterium flaccumfaciens pv. oortii]|uniref:hypothetical protein n=1 Tax=Curtobacterium flaccumfaciens TaxID=2035 RepID=UPI001BDE7FDF|nr:hypothetical protein [Curtobacterium flaccumfaciens]MBT1623522.1 hypothetical protein [Curtobacterium flaccumfaciens pv. oortii]
MPKTTTANDGVPGPVFYKRLQCLASMPSSRPYTGPIDGVMGPNSWMGAQARLAVGGYYWLPSLEGYENPYVIMALKHWANDHGYNLPLNSQWTGSSYAAVANVLNQSF